MRLGLCGALACVLFLACIPDPKLKLSFDMTPTDIGDGWILASPDEVQMDAARLRTAYELFYAEDDYPTAISLLVVRHGKLVAEGYCRHRSDRTLAEHIQSATKSFTALALGLTRDQGYFPDLDAKLHDFIASSFDRDAKKREITLRHLLTMRSGVAFDNDDFSLEIIVDAPRHPLSHILKKPLYAAPGAEYYYRDADPHLLSGAVQAHTGKSLEAWTRERLFKPLGIRDVVWEADVEGRSFGPFGLFLRPRDLAKVGQLMLDRGRFHGQALLSSSWIDEVTRFQTEVNEEPSTRGFDYGYYFWLVPELGAYTTWGHGGNFVFVVPASDLVIVFTGEPDADDDTVGTELREFLRIARLIIAASR